MIIGIQPKLRTAALLAQYIPFDAMISKIEQIIKSDQAVTSRGRERLQVMDESVDEELAELQEKKRQFKDYPRKYNVWDKQGTGTMESPIGPRDDILPFGFNSEKTCYRCKLIGHLASFRGIICERESPVENVYQGGRKPSSYDSKFQKK